MEIARLTLSTVEQMQGLKPGSLNNLHNAVRFAREFKNETWLDDELEGMNSTLQLDLSDDV